MKENVQYLRSKGFWKNEKSLKIISMVHGEFFLLCLVLWFCLSYVRKYKGRLVIRQFLQMEYINLHFRLSENQTFLLGHLMGNW